MKIMALIAALSVQTWASTLVVGPTRPFKTIAEAIGSLVPLSADVVLYVEMPSGNYSSSQNLDAGSPDWNGFKVTVLGVFSVPDIVGYVGEDLVYGFVGDKMDIHHENLVGLNGSEVRTESWRTKVNLKDHLGSTRLTFDEAGGVDEATGYESYGKTSSLVSGPSKTVEKYTGKELDGDGAGVGGEPGINLDYFGARFYDPDLAMWISPDPARQFSSPYSFGPNPVNSVDPDGRLQVYTDKFDDMAEICLDGDNDAIHYIGKGGREWFTFTFPSTAVMDFMGIDSYGVSLGVTASTPLGMKWGLNYQYFRSTGEWERYEYMGGTLGAELSAGISVNYAWFHSNGVSGAVGNKESWYGPFREASGNAGIWGFGYFMSVGKSGDPYWLGVNGGPGVGAGFSAAPRVDYQKSILNNPNYQFPKW